MALKNGIISFRLISVLIVALALAWSVTAKGQNGNPEDGPRLVAEMDEQEYLAWTREFLSSLTPQTGEIKLSNAIATLNMPESFYYLSPEDSARVLTEGWGNPPGQATLGMIFPAGLTPLDPGAWGVNILYQEDGYVSDQTIGDLDFDEILTGLKADTLAESEARVAKGRDATELIGWAVAPHYDAGSHKLYWAKELKFADNPVNILNYDIRILGRKGVLRLNFIADIGQLPDIEAVLPEILAMTDFDQGFAYTDFDPETDEVANYGIGSLVAGKVLPEPGFLAAIVAFLKTFGLAILVALAAAIAELVRRKRQAIAAAGNGR